MTKYSIQTLVVPLAGAGTRLRPITYVTPKEMLRLVDKPIIYYLFAEAYQAGIRHVLLVTHVDNSFTKDFFEGSKATPLLADFPGLRLSFVETDRREGDGQAILLAKKIMGNELFAVSMGDMLCLPGTSVLAELMEVYHATGEGVLSVEEVARENIGQYGVIVPGQHQNNIYQVRGIVEKPMPHEAPSNLAMTGKYILPYDIFSYLEMRQNSSGEWRLADALNNYAKDHILNACICRTTLYDTGKKPQLFNAEVVFSLAHPELKEMVNDIKIRPA